MPGHDQLLSLWQGALADAGLAVDLSSEIRAKDQNGLEQGLSKILSRHLQSGDQSQMIARLETLETALKRQRRTEAGHWLLDKCLGSEMPEPGSVRSVWCVGCGEAFEAGWIEARYPTARKVYLDADPRGLAVAREELARINAQAAEVLLADLTRAEAWPEETADLILFLHPFVIEHATYQSLVSWLMSGAKANEVEASLATLVVSPKAAQIFASLVAHMRPESKLVIATLDGLEKRAVENTLDRLGLGITSWRCPFAPATVASLAVGKAPMPLLEPRHFHHVLSARRIRF